MHVDYFIIGQGISGTWLSYFLQKEGKSFIVIDNNAQQTASRIAAGIINPVTGRRHVSVWMADEILPFALENYKQLGHELNVPAISHKDLLDFFPTPQMRVSFMQRVEEKNPYVHAYPEQNKFNTVFNYDFGCGEIRPVYIVHLESLLPAWRKHLKDQNLLQEEEFDINKLERKKNGIRYNDIEAGKIIFCDGQSSAINPYFAKIPFALNKGEALIVEITDLPDQHIYKKGMMLAPLSSKDLWWIGSNYAWEFSDSNPTTDFYEKTEKLLKEWLKLPFKIIEHYSGIRPATLERRPFVGLHPQHPSIGIFNGMGTKGCSLAPYFAKQFVDHLVYHLPLNPEADLNRFQKILSRS